MFTAILKAIFQPHCEIPQRQKKKVQSKKSNDFKMIHLHFKNGSKTPFKGAKSGSNVHNIRCQQMQFTGNCIRISFSPEDLKDGDVKRVLTGRKLNEYGDSKQKFIEIKCSELYDATVRTDMR